MRQMLGCQLTCVDWRAPSCPRPPGGCDNHPGSIVGEARSYLIMTDRPLKCASRGQYHCGYFPVNDLGFTASIREQSLKSTKAEGNAKRRCRGGFVSQLPCAFRPNRERRQSVRRGSGVNFSPTDLTTVIHCLKSRAEPLNASRPRRDALVFLPKSKSSPFLSLSITTVHKHHG
jgi:hypothetical protein